MGAADEVKAVSVEELADDIGSKGEGHTPIVLPPALSVLVGVRPEQVAQQACERESGMFLQSNVDIK